MLLLLFLHGLFGDPVRPHGWEKRTDARPYLGSTVTDKDAKPQQAEPLESALQEKPGWEVHVRTTPGPNADDWRARVTTNAQPISFWLHRTAWPADDWVWYQMLGRLHIAEDGRHTFGLVFLTGDAGIGCFGQLIVGGAEAVRVDIPEFFSRRKPNDPSRDEIIFNGTADLARGTYDAIVTIGCHPGKIGQRRVAAHRIEAWHDSKFIVAMQKPGERALRPLRGSEISYVTR